MAHGRVRPAGGSRAARHGRRRTPIQAIRVGETTWATQFHAEVDAAEAEYWVSVASAQEDLEATWGKSPEALRAEIAEHMAAHEARGRETFRRFVEVCRGT